MLLPEKVALVTGASRGIGRAVAEAFAREGAALVLAARGDAIHAAAEALRGTGARATAVQGDVREEATVRACIQACRKEYGRLDVLVNNAGAMPQGVLGMIPLAGSRELFDLNVLALVNLTQFAARMMKPGGSIVNLASIAWQGLAGMSLYSATKGAVVGFTRAAAKELAPRGVRVNAIAPGLIETDLIRDLPPDVRERTLAGIGLGRIGRPEDVAGAALFLASELSAYVTGQVLGVDGGMQA